MRLEGKRALVTGAGIGIGRETALELARQGARVVLSYHASSAGAESAVEEIRAWGGEAYAIQANLANAEECIRLVEAAVERLGGLDILVNNAGRTDVVPFLDVTPAQFDELYHINVRGQFFCAQQAARYMREQGGGTIINLTSVLGLAALPEHSVYEGTKGAIIAWTRGLAVELAPYRIRVNAIAPGAIEVPRYYDRPGYTPEAWGTLIPWGRVGHPIDIAKVCAFLASDEAAYITGAIIPVDGGLTARLAFFPESLGEN